MKKLNLYEAICGVCRFSISGVFPERFLNICARSDMGLYDISRSGDEITAWITAARYKGLRHAARKCRVRLRIKEKAGLPFRLIPYRKRAGLLLGLPLFCGTLWLLSQFIWIIEMPTLSAEMNDKFVAAAELSGLHTGALRASIDGEMIEHELMMELNDLSWVGLCVEGSRVVVDARELDAPPQKVDVNSPCNIIASHSGIVKRFECQAGRIAAEAGQAVAEGDLLIGGVYELTDGSVIMSHAQGRVVAEVRYEFSAEIPYRQTKAVRTGKVKTIRRVSAMGIDIPIYNGSIKYELYERENSMSQLTVGETKLPFSVRTERYFELQTISADITREEAEQMAAKELENKLAEIQYDRLISSSQGSTDTGTSLVMTMNVTVEQNIAKEADILFSEENY